MHFEHSERVKQLQRQLTAFMDAHIYPRLQQYRDEVKAGQYPVSFMADLKALAKSEGLWNLFLRQHGVTAFICHTRAAQTVADPVIER